MSKSDPLRQLWLAGVLLTRLPLPPLPADAFAQGARAAWTYPLVGVGIGAVGAVSALLTAPLGSIISALFAVAAMILLTGAMHEDGLADVCDGFWGGMERDRRLAIMRDSQIGTYGVLGLLVITGLRILAIAGLEAGMALIAAAAVSRATMPVLMTALPHARGDGLAHSVGRPSGLVAAFGAGLGALTALACLGWVAFPVVAGVGLTTLCIGLLAKRKIGGHTGDVLGSSQQIGEATALLIALALIA